MKFLFSICFTLLSYTSLFATSQSLKEKIFLIKDSYRILVPYESNGVFVLDEILLKNAELQEVEHRQFYKDKKSLIEAIKTRTTNLLGTSGLQLTSSEEIVWQEPEFTAPIWEGREDWSQSWERKFETWVSDEFTRDFFVRYNIETDCADVAYALRWIFARINKLNIGNRLSGSMYMFTNRSLDRRWRRLPTHRKWYKDRRFLAALDYLLDNTYTKTLSVDTYPVKLDKEVLTSSTIYMPYHGHTTIITINNSDEASSFDILSSNSPRKIRNLFLEHSFGSQPEDEFAGIRKFRRYKSRSNSLVPANDMPNFSREQYSPDLLRGDNTFTAFLYEKVFSISLYDLTLLLVKTVQSYVEARIEIVNEGFQFCLVNNCSKGTANYDSFSTPSRDDRLRLLVLLLKNSYRALPSAQRNRVFTILLEDIYEVANETSKSLLSMVDLFLSKDYETDPNLDPKSRWGGEVSIFYGLESRHPYANFKEKVYTVTGPDVRKVRLRVEYKLEEISDYLTLSGDNTHIVLTGYGEEVIEVSDANLKILFNTDSSIRRWGYKIHELNISEP